MKILPLQDGKTYLDGRGQERTVMGATPDHPDWVWTQQGDWYDRASGRLVRFGKLAEPSVLDLVAESAR